MQKGATIDLSNVWLRFRYYLEVSFNYFLIFVLFLIIWQRNLKKLLLLVNIWFSNEFRLTLTFNFFQNLIILNHFFINFI